MEDNKLIAVFMSVPPEIEYEVGSVKNQTVCYSPKQVGHYFVHPEQQKTECERFLKEQADKYPDGRVIKGGHEVIRNEWYPYYNSDWSKLMPVVEKIESMAFLDITGFSFNIIQNHVCIYCHERNRQDGVIYQSIYGKQYDSKISAVYEAVAEFIKWYNSNSTPTV